MSEFQLTKNGIDIITKHRMKKTVYIAPILQILKYNDHREKIKGQELLREQFIYTVFLSDGEKFCKVVFAKNAGLKLRQEEFIDSKTQEFDLIYSIIQLDEWITKQSNEKTTIIALEFTFIGKGTSQIGIPVEYNLDQQSSKLKISLTLQEESSPKQQLPQPPIQHQQNQQQQHITPIEQNQQKQVTKSLVIKNNKVKQKVDIKEQSFHQQQVQMISSPTIQNEQRQSFFRKQTNPPITKSFNLIDSLIPLQTGWILQARVLNKSAICIYNRKDQSGTGNYFRIIIIDEVGSTIPCIFFEKACEKYYSMLQINQVYIFQNGSIKLNQYDGTQNIYFENFSIVSEMENDQKIPYLPTIKQTKICDIKNLSENTIVDLIAVVNEEQRDSKKITYILFDETSKITLHFWGPFYQNISLKQGQIIIVKNLKLTVFNTTCQLNSQSTTILIEDTIKLSERCKQLEEWKKKNTEAIELLLKDDGTFICRNLQEVTEKAEEMLKLQKHRQTLVSTVSAFIMDVQRRQIIYPGCSEGKCLKKLTYDDQRNKFFCPNCHKEIQQPRYRYLLRAKIVDNKDSLQVTIYDDISQKLLLINANEFSKMTEVRRQQWLNTRINQEKKLKILMKFQTYEGAIKPLFEIMDIEDINYLSEAQDRYEDLMNMIKQQQAIDII